MARGRGKVKLQFVEDATARRATLRKRSAGLVKKVSELSTLCGVPACLVVYGAGEAEPKVVWPSAEAATALLQRFGGLPESEKTKNMLDMEGLLRRRIDQAEAQLHSARRNNLEREASLVIVDFMAGRRKRLDDVSGELCSALRWVVDMRLHAIAKRMESLRLEATTSSSLPLPPPQQQQDEPPMAVTPLAMAPMVAAPDAGMGADEPSSMDEEPRHGSYLKEVLDACDTNGDGSGVPSTEELEEMYKKAGLAWPLLKNSSS